MKDFRKFSAILDPSPPCPQKLGWQQNIDKLRNKQIVYLII